MLYLFERIYHTCVTVWLLSHWIADKNMPGSRKSRTVMGVAGYCYRGANDVEAKCGLGLDVE